MTDPVPPAPPSPLLADAPAAAAAPWQERLEVVSLLLLLSAAVTVVARVVGAYDQEKSARSGDLGSVDLVSVVQLAGQSVAPIAAGSVLVAFLLVTLGPGDRISTRGVLALRAATVIGLGVAGLAGFAAIASLLESHGATGGLGLDVTGQRDALDRVSTALPLVVAGVLATYTAWCAFSALGEASGSPD